MPKLFREWDGIDTDCKFKVVVRTDSDHAKCPVMRRGLIGIVVYLNRALVTFKISLRK